MQEIISIRPRWVSQVQDGDVETVFFLGDPRIVSKQVALGVRTEERHTGGQSILNVGIQEERGFSRSAGGGDEGVDIVRIHDGPNGIALLLWFLFLLALVRFRKNRFLFPVLL